MTMQQAEKPSVDMVAQLSEVFAEDKDSGTKVLISKDVHVGCTLRDATLQELVSQINVWTLVSSKFTVAPSKIDPAASDLLEQMAEADAFLKTGSGGFFYPDIEDNAVQSLTRP